MKKNSSIAVIGCGRIAGHHCRSIKKFKELNLVAVCDLDETKAKNYGVEFNIPSFTNYYDMFTKHPEIGTVVIATPSGMHFEHGLELIQEFKKNIVVEKPTFMRPSQLKEAYSAAAREKVSIFPVFQNRYNKAVRRVQAGIQSGELGQVRIASVRVRWCRPQRYYDLAPWRGTFAQDGGAITNQGIHHVDLIRFLGGEVARVSAQMKTLGAQIEVEDTAVAALEYASGAVGALEITTAARPDDFEASISFVCEKGLAQIGGIAVNELQIYTPDKSACALHSEDFSGNVYGHGHEELYRQINNFFQAGTPYEIKEDDVLNSLTLLHSFYRADEQKNWVQVNSKEESSRLGQSDEKLAALYRTKRPENKR